MKITLILLAFVIGIYEFFLFQIPDKQTTFNYLFNVAYALIFLFGGYIALARAKIFGLAPNLQRSMWFFAIGMLMFASGLLVWTYYNLILKVPVPYPSIADVLFLLYYPNVILGGYFMMLSFGNEITKKLSFEGLIVFVLFFAILYAFLNQTSLGETLPFWERFLNLAYPFADSLLIASAITLLRTEKGVSSHPNILYFVFAFLILAAADTMFSYRSSNDLYWNGDIADFLFALSGFLSGLGFLSFRKISLSEKIYK